MSRRAFQTVRVGEQIFEFEVMIFGGELSDLRPLLIFHSIEFPLPPSEAFCDTMRDAGLQVVFVRRAGFGQSSPLPKALVTREPIESGATAMAEAVMMRSLIAKLDLSDVVLLAMGSSNIVAYRLVLIAPEISFTVFANPVFNQDIMQVFTPLWFQKMLKQILTSQSGLKVAIQGMKMMLQRDPVGYYKHIYQKNDEDLRYVTENSDDYCEAGALALETDPAQLYYDTIMLLGHDAMLKDGFFTNTNGTIMIGEKSSEHWRTEMKREAARVGLPVIQAPKGDLFCAYASPQTLITAIKAVKPSSAAAAG